MPVRVVMTGIPPRGIGVRGIIPTIPVVVTVLTPMMPVPMVGMMVVMPPRVVRIVVAAAIIRAAIEADRGIAAAAGDEERQAAEDEECFQHHRVPHAAATKGLWFPWSAAMRRSRSHSQVSTGSSLL
jgi:hypothetical protein